MNYKYKKRQIFGKRLKVPKHILSQIYNCLLSFSEFVEYDLEDKIPITCLNELDRQIAIKFGIEKAKTLDWELLRKVVYYNAINFRRLLLGIDASVEDLNASLYELVKDQIKPKDYSLGMKAFYKDRFFEVAEDTRDDLKYEKIRFNNGDATLKDLVHNWDLFKDKNLSFCLRTDEDNEFDITDSQLKEFMRSFGTIANLILDYSDIYKFIHEISEIKSESERREYVRRITDHILEKTIRRESSQRVIKLSDREYAELFKYSSMQDYLKRANSYSEYDIDVIFEELKDLSQGYINDIPIPFQALNNSDVLSFISTYGLKNIVDFDNECGHFFTKNNCQMLKLMKVMYLLYAGNEHDSNKTIYTIKPYDENGNYVDRLYTKDEFYEAMKRMIVYGPSNWDYADKAPDYRDMTGEFRTRNPQLFISEQAPVELQKDFYTKNITPNLLLEHPDYIRYLCDKDLESCFRLRQVQVYESNAMFCYENFYDFIGKRTDFNSLMGFITEYCDVLDIVFNGDMTDSYLYEVKLSEKDSLSEIKRRINEIFRRLVIEKGIVYPKVIPKDLIEIYPSMFLSPKAPKDLQEVFYSRTLTSRQLSNPSFREFLDKVELEIMFSYMPVNVKDGNHDYDQINLVSAIKHKFGLEDSFDVMSSYGDYIELAFKANKLHDFKFDPNFSKEGLLDALDDVIIKTIIDGKMKYDENLPSHFKKRYPTLFLSRNVPHDISQKFYNRELTLNDFNTNLGLLDLLGDTNVVCGFSMDISWMIPLFSENSKEANRNRLKTIAVFSKIQDIALQDAFKQFVIEFSNTIDMEIIECIPKLMSRLSLSNSSEIFRLRRELAAQLLKLDNPIGTLDKIEEIFIKNNIPTIGKIYSCFEILHPNFQGFDFSDRSIVSPVLKKSSIMDKRIIVFSDLIKSFLGSNNKSINNYLKNIEVGSELYESIKSGKLLYDSLNDGQKRELIIFSRHLATLYNNTMKGKKENGTFTTTGDVLADILELSKRLSPDGTLDYSLADRVVKMFCGFAGIDTLEQAKRYVVQKIRAANIRNRHAASKEVVLKLGDFVKGIGNITYLRNILQNGSVSREYLGSSAASDLTPLDTDVAIITLSEGTIKDKLSGTIANDYGPIWFVLKNDERFITTRTISGILDIKNDMSKMEAFYTGVIGRDHYGIRTGFASSEVDYIVIEDYDQRVGLEIAMNGFYIPVVNKEGNIVFTPNDYDRLRQKMSGLSYYDENSYNLSDNLVNDETAYLVSQLEQSNYEVQIKRAKINEAIKKSLEELGLHLKNQIDGDLSEGFAELIDIGSTGRGTNKPGSGDFDFIMRLDKAILHDPSKKEKLKQVLLKNLGEVNSQNLTNEGDFRLKGVQIDRDTYVDIDITFTVKTDKISYSSDMALQDRLGTIKKISQEKYKFVVANILLAKQVLKQAGVYKPRRGDDPQGGLGGIGIENWILQNGGSFIDAAKSFIDAANEKSFEEFKSSYQIWDFGQNHLSERRGQYLHDDFVANNMSEEGYHKMVRALKEYVNNYMYNKTSVVKEADTIKS